MLGVRRASVTETVNIVQQAGLIRCNRGMISFLNQISGRYTAQMDKNISVTIVIRESQVNQSRRTQSAKQLNLWESPQSQKDQASYLR